MKTKYFYLIFAFLLLPFYFSFGCGSGGSGGTTITTTTSTTSTTATSSSSSFEAAQFDPTKISTESAVVGGSTIQREYVSNQIIVALESGKAQDDLEAILPSGYSVVGWDTDSRLYQVSIPSGTSVSSALSTVNNLSSSVISDTGKNFVVQTCLTPNDPYFNTGVAYRWTFTDEATNFTNAWDITTGASSVIIAIIDTGLDLDHVEFSGRISSDKKNFIDNNNDPDESLALDSSGHGTNVAGVAVAIGNNGQYMAGADWNSTILPIKAIKNTNNTDAFTCGVAIKYAITNGAKIINCSFGMYLDPSTNSDDLVAANQFTRAATLAASSNAVIIAAAGNDGRDVGYFYPAALGNTSLYPDSPIIAVGGYAKDGGRWDDSLGSSNFGTAIDICAPANNILSTTFTGGIATARWGTSMAAPFVAGAASLIYALYPDSTSLGVRLALTDTESTDGINANNIGRKLDAYKALLRAMYYKNQALVSVASSLEGATVYVDNVSTGKTTTTEGYTRVVVDAGTRTIKASKTGYSDDSASISCTKGTNTNTTLTPSTSGTEHEFGPYSAAGQHTATLEVPAGSRVYIGNLAFQDAQTTEVSGFFDCGYGGYFRINGTVKIRDPMYSDPGSFTTFYGQRTGDYMYATTEATGVSAQYATGCSISSDRLYIEITYLITLGQDNVFKIYRHNDNPNGKGYVIKIE